MQAFWLVLIYFALIVEVDYAYLTYNYIRTYDIIVYIYGYAKKDC